MDILGHPWLVFTWYVVLQEYIAGPAVLIDLNEGLPVTHKRPSASIFTCFWPSKVRKKHLESKLPRSFRCCLSSSGFWFWCALFRDFWEKQKIPRPTQIFSIILDAVHSFNSVPYIPISKSLTLKYLS